MIKKTGNLIIQYHVLNFKGINTARSFSELLFWLLRNGNKKNQNTHLYGSIKRRLPFRKGIKQEDQIKVATDFYEYWTF